MFGADTVFRSSRAIPGGAVFPPILEEKAASCAVMLVVIGRHWLADDGGTRRIDEPGDWVRKEIEIALANKRQVIPVLTGDRPRLESEDKLPTTIAELVNHNYLRFHHRSEQYDLMHIVDEVHHHIAEHGVWVPGPANALLLTSLSPTQRSSDVRFGAAELNGRYFGDSILYRPSLFASQPRGSISFNLGRKYRRLEVTAGVLDNAAEADQVGVFKVVADGNASKQVTATLGLPQLITVDVTGVLNLRLEAHRPGTTAHPLMAGANVAGGVSNKLPELAWGDPMLFP